MAQLTTMDEKLGEVIGLAMAAKGATGKVERLLDDETCLQTLRRMHEDAAKVEDLGTELVGRDAFQGRKTAILDKARETRREAEQMMETYLQGDVDGLDGFEFLTMAEAGELGHWKVVETLNEQLGDRDIKELTDFVVPMQEQHLRLALDGSLVLAAKEDPAATGG